MLEGLNIRILLRYSEIAGIILTICLLPIDRFPYLHHVPLRLGAVSFLLLLFAALARTLITIYQRRWIDVKRIGIVALLLILPIIAYAQSIHYAIDRPLTVGATKLLLIVAIKAWCFFVLLYEVPKYWQTVKLTFYVVTAVIIAFGFFQFLFDIFGASQSITDLRNCCTSNSTYVFPRVHSVSIEPLYFANFLIIPMLLMINDLVFHKSSRQNRLLLALFLATSTLFILSLARSAILGIIIALAIFAWGSAKHINYRIITKFLGGILLTALIFVITAGVASHFIHKSAINGSNAGVEGNLAIFSSHAVAVADQSAQTRYSTWPKSVNFIKENPLKGVGAYNSRVRLNLNQYHRGVPDIQLQPFNNDLIGLLVDLGLIGVVAFAPVVVSLFISLSKSFKKHWRSPSAPYALAAIAMLIQSNFFQSILLARLWVVVGIALTGLFTSRNLERAHENSH